MKIDIANDHSWFGWSQWDCRGQIKFSSMGHYHRLFDQAYFSLRRKVIMGGYIRETKKVSNLTADRRPLVFGFGNHYQRTKNQFQVLKGARNLYYGSREQRMTFYYQRRYWKTSQENKGIAASLSWRCLHKEEQDGWLYTWIHGVKKPQEAIICANKEAADVHVLSASHK